MVIDLHGRLLEISHGAIEITTINDNGKELMQMDGITIEKKEETVLAQTTTKIESTEMAAITMTATVVIVLIAIAITIVNMSTPTIIEIIGIIDLTFPSADIK